TLAAAAEGDFSLVQSIRLTYWHTYTAENDMLRCRAQGGQRVMIDGFNSSAIRVFDVTEADAVVELPVTVEPVGGAFAAQVDMPALGGPERTLLAVAENRMREPAALAPHLPSAWNAPAQSADVVMIAHRNFVTSLQPLRQLR